MGDTIGVKVVVSQDALNHIKDKLMPYTEAQVMATRFADTESCHCAGKIKVETHNLVVTCFHVSSSSIELISPNVLAVSFSGINIKAEMEWRYNIRTIRTSAHGRVDGCTCGSSVRVVFVLGTDDQGRPTAKVSDCWVEIKDFSLKFHCRLQWLCNLLADLFNGQIVRSVDHAVRHAITCDLQTVIDRMLSRIPVVEHAGKDYVIDYRLSPHSGLFIVPERLLVAQSAGVFHLEHGDPGQYPGLPVCMPNNENGSMFQIFISAFSVQSFCHDVVCSGKYQRDFFDDSTIVPLPFFQTSFYLEHAPGLVSKFGDDKKISFHFEPHETPTVTISEEKKVIVDAGIEMTIRVHTSTESFENVLTVVLQTLCTCNATVVDTTIIAEVFDVQAELKLLDSSVGTFDVKTINEAVNGFLRLLKPELNKKLAQGFPLPSMKGIQFLNPQVHFHNGFFVVTTDINYTPDF